jgi:hypothetical protein
VNSPLDVKENCAHALDLLLTCIAFFSLGEFGIFLSNSSVQLMLSSPNACPTIVKVSIALPVRFAQNLMDTFSGIHHEIISSQIQNSK